MKLVKYIICSTLLGAIITGCADKFLDVQPDNRLQIDSYEKAAELLVYAANAGSYVFLEQMTDNVAYIAENSHAAGLDNELFNWDETLNEHQDTPSYYWNSGYSAIAQANATLNYIDELEGDTKHLNHIKGEALLFRAYNHFMLVNIFAKSYDPATAASDAGIPYVEELEKNLITEYKNNSLQEVYDFIERDMLKGLELINDTYVKSAKKYHFTRNAALAFASRFYLWTGNDQKCIQYSTEMLGATPQKFIKDYATILNAGGIDGAGIAFINTSDESNLMVARRETLNSLRYYSKDRLNIGKFYEIFNVSFIGTVADERAQIAYYGNGSNTSLHMAKNYEYFRRNSLSSNIGMPYRIDILFRGEEVILNRAEAYSNIEKKDESISDLELLLNNRYTDAYGGLLKEFTTWVTYYKYVHGGAELAAIEDENEREAAILADMIKGERRREFIEEGMRWFDIKRYGISVVRANGNRLKEYDARKIVPIPKIARESLGLENSEPDEMANKKKLQLDDVPDFVELFKNL